jgi:hypothetical protein
MTIEERLSALTMNLELTARETADLRESLTELKDSVSNLAEKVDVLVLGTSNLLRVAEGHERRILRLEGGAE